MKFGTFGKGWYIDGYLARTLDMAKERVLNKGWDYVGVICGLPGSGKSTLARTCAKYCDPNFSIDNICFTAKEFIEVTNNAKEHSAIVLDESFQSLNARVAMSSDFLMILNHLQVIRQKHLFIFLCLPNYFDLSKGVAIFRSSHLFVTYAQKDGTRGRFTAFDRTSKRLLYIEGAKYMNYSAVQANYYGSFKRNNGLIDDGLYEEKKLKHLLAQNKTVEVKSTKSYRETYLEKKKELAIAGLWQQGWTLRKIAQLFGEREATIQNLFKKLRETNKVDVFTRDNQRIKQKLNEKPAEVTENNENTRL